MSNSPAGWYPDPSGDTTKVRYWDGMQWTEHLSDAQSSTHNAQAMQPTPAKSRVGSAVASLVLALVGAAFFSLIVFPVIGPFIISLVVPPALICALLAIICGIIGYKGTARTVAVIGIVLGCLIFLVFCGLMVWLVG
jgi:hypothetical protein